MTRLKELQIHGFKSFANTTNFVFDEGVTAIVGPNGSGKSNVAEALRWVLGEQHYTALRGRRTEDVIFAGSERRGQQGMAEVTLLLDNSDGGLPTEFRELALTRRAFRSGENHYLINSSRVRLKDIQQLTAPLGQAHTIIGQGLVDAVLSQRPEDRRGLFEHAAGITGLRLRAVEAERGLAEASGNAQRLHDILAELEPRVRSLERAARQAREYGSLRARLDELQRGYYANLWHDLGRRLSAAQQALTVAEQALEAIETEQRAAARRQTAVRARERELTAQIGALQRALADQERKRAELRHQGELLEAAQRSALQRIAGIDRDRHDLTARRAQSEVEAQTAARSISELSQALSARNDELTQLEQQQAAERARSEALADDTVVAAEVLRALTKRRNELDARLGSLTEREILLAEEHVERQRGLASEETERARLTDALDALDSAHAALLIRVGEASTSVTSYDATLAEQQAALAEQRAREADVERELTTLRTRLDLLERTAESGEGLFGGARAILRAVRREQLALPGLVGMLAELIDVPAGYETAIEIALGGHLQDLVVRRWSDAENAIEFLKRSNGGRATFQPLETVRSPRAVRCDLSDPDLLGSAFELIDYRPEVEPVLAQLLQRTLVVRDLAATRRLLGQSSGWTIVTLSGEIARPGGSVTGGAAARGAGLLGRERERRELPGRISTLERALAQSQADAQELTAAVKSDTDARAVVAAQLETLQRTVREQAAERARLERDRDRARERMARAEAVHHAGSERHERVSSEIAEIRRQQSTLAADLEVAEQRAAALEQLRRVSEPDEDARLTELRIELATLSERLSARQRDRLRADETTVNLADALTARTTELDQLQRRHADSQRQREELERAEIALAADLEVQRRAAEPLEQARATLFDEIRAAEQAVDLALGRVRAGERERDNLALSLARVRDEQVFLIERIQNDLDLDEPEQLSEAEALSGAEIEQEIRRLRERLRRMSAIGEEVVDEHAQEAARLEHLSRELADVEQAADSLRRLLGDLRRGMRQRFQLTFEQVAAEFERTFTRLFGGGGARLTHLTGEDGDDGVAIEARPPGKRLQNLGQLSGGERALTAVALLFAIQRVNPSPFCVLDEVDAALDESNVLRFRDELRDLAQTTQYIVITHNRGTIEGADTLYGITMGEDSVSRVVSLRLEQAIQQVEEREHLARTAD